MALERSQRRLQHWFRPCSDRRSGRGAIKSQSLGSSNRDNFGIPLWESQDKSHSDATPVGECREYYREYGGGISRVRAMVSYVSPRSPVACPNIKCM
jgi:hypothetical protein